ncbi:MAG: hypothetical protein QHH27_00995 [Clostridia bacterium]|jgi:hypothetical protein|nr:hypothetical protein [Clostridia bacterium]MDH7572125.1 hypothetical protein [Clostridia bacterium]
MGKKATGRGSPGGGGFLSARGGPRPRPGYGGQKPAPPDGETARQDDGITERICGPEDLERLGIPVLGCVPEFRQE